MLLYASGRVSGCEVIYKLYVISIIHPKRINICDALLIEV